MNTPRYTTIVTFALLMVLLGGCAGTPKKTATGKSASAKDEYVYYTPTGSNLPIRVRKEQVTTNAAQTEQDQALIRDLQRRGSHAVPDEETVATRHN